MEFKDLTIIIPAFNAQNYISEILDDISFFRDAQLIIVNDGSSDMTLDFLHKYSSCYEGNMLIINQSHCGVSAARNTGLRAAKTKYIMFADADDRLNVAEIDKISTGLDDDFDMAVLSSYAKTATYAEINMPTKKVVDSIFGSSEFAGYVPAAFSKIYRTKFLKDNDIEFPCGITKGEDSIFQMQIIKKIKRMKFLNIDFYLYRENPLSVTRSYRYDIVNNYEKTSSMLSNIILSDTNFRNHDELLLSWLLREAKALYLSGHWDDGKIKWMVEAYNAIKLNKVQRGVTKKSIVFLLIKKDIFFPIKFWWKGSAVKSEKREQRTNRNSEYIRI